MCKVLTKPPKQTAQIQYASVRNTLERIGYLENKQQQKNSLNYQ